MAFVINVNKWLMWTVGLEETMYLMWWNPFFAVTKSALDSWATLLISSHPAMCETQCGLSILPKNTRR